MNINRQNVEQMQSIFHSLKIVFFKFDNPHDLSVGTVFVKDNLSCRSYPLDIVYSSFDKPTLTWHCYFDQFNGEHSDFDDFIDMCDRFDSSADLILNDLTNGNISVSFFIESESMFDFSGAYLVAFNGATPLHIKAIPDPEINEV